MKGTEEFRSMTRTAEISEKGKRWLKEHGMEYKAQNVTENCGTLEFVTKSRNQGYYTLNVVILKNGSWGSHDVVGKMLKENY